MERVSDLESLALLDHLASLTSQLEGNIKASRCNLQAKCKKKKINKKSEENKPELIKKSPSWLPDLITGPLIAFNAVQIDF